MSQVTRIFVPMSREEIDALIAASKREMRHPREHARYLLRAALLSDPPDQAEAKQNGAAKVSQAHGAVLPTL